MMPPAANEEFQTEKGGTFYDCRTRTWRWWYTWRGRLYRGCSGGSRFNARVICAAGACGLIDSMRRGYHERIDAMRGS
jgi:hypothetical protein